MGPGAATLERDEPQPWLVAIAGAPFLAVVVWAPLNFGVVTRLVSGSAGLAIFYLGAAVLAALFVGRFTRTTPRRAPGQVAALAATAVAMSVVFTTLELALVAVLWLDGIG